MKERVLELHQIRLDSSFVMQESRTGLLQFKLWAGPERFIHHAELVAAVELEGLLGIEWLHSVLDPTIASDLW